MGEKVDALSAKADALIDLIVQTRADFMRQYASWDKAIAGIGERRERNGKRLGLAEPAET